jgi:hypothetical protein
MAPVKSIEQPKYTKRIKVCSYDKDGKPCRKSKLVSCESAYWNNKGRLQKRLDKLNEKRMPKSGACEKRDSMLELLRHVQAMYRFIISPLRG